MRLSNMRENQMATIVKVNNGVKNKRRLYDLGFMTGQKIVCTNKAIFGTPIAYEIQGTKIALRKEDAKGIGVSL